MKKYAFIFLVLVAFVAGRVSHQPRANAQNAPPPCQDVNGDGDANITDAVFLLNWLFLGGPEPTCECESTCPPPEPCSLPATGQITCYDAFGAEIACDNPTCPGQDGFHRSGCPLENRFIDNLDGTVTDNCTGLMWQKDMAPGTHSWQGALQYCEDLELAGREDWRIPNIRELNSIVDYARWGPATDPIFPTFRPGLDFEWNFWSSTSFARRPGEAWLVNFFNGNFEHPTKDTLLSVRAVAGCRP